VLLTDTTLDPEETMLYVLPSEDQTIHESILNGFKMPVCGQLN